MRIISQNKEVDIPYENVFISVIGKEVLAYSTSDLEGTTYWELGTYKNKDRALEVMKEIRMQYADNEIWKIGVRNAELGTFSPCFEMPEE